VKAGGVTANATPVNRLATIMRLRRSAEIFFIGYFDLLTSVN